MAQAKHLVGKMKEHRFKIEKSKEKYQKLQKDK